MSNKAKSQWDFGELFPKEETRKVLTVSELTGQVRRALEKQIGQIWVTGEITNLRFQSSGHIYFTLKDAGSQLSCVLFRGEALSTRNSLQDGQKVVLQGDLTVYEPRGQYQLIVRAVELQGIGALQVAFEKLKEKLAGEGLFALERKRPLPRYPQRIGLVTSPTGAAIRDVLHVIQRRNPGLEIILTPCRVQGQGAAEEIAAAIRLLNQWNSASGSKLDLILITRGGGSLEDLWAFNEETVARAVFESALPVVSAVGHEIDFTISDFVADLRAATPSAAAEIITEGPFASREFVAEATSRMRRLVRQRMERDREDLERLADRLTRVHPRRHLNDQLQRLDDLESSLLRSAKYGLREAQTRWLMATQRFVNLKPGQMINERRTALAETVRRLQEQATHQLESRKNRLAQAQAKLRLLSPHNVLERGYSITLDAESGQVIRHVGDVKPGQRLKTRLQQGEVRSTVEKPESP